MYTVHDQLFVSINTEDVLVPIDPHCIGWSMNEYMQLVYVEMLAFWTGLQCIRGAIITVQLQMLISHSLFSDFKKTLFLSLKLQNFSQKMGGPKDNKTTHSPLILG